MNNKLPDKCKLCAESKSDITHELFLCKHVKKSADVLVDAIKSVDPDATESSIVKLGWNTSDSLTDQSMVFLTGYILDQIWSYRKRNIRPDADRIQSELAADLLILRSSKFRNVAVQCETVLGPLGPTQT